MCSALTQPRSSLVKFVKLPVRPTQSCRIQVDLSGTMREYKILHVFEFTSERKLMGVVARTPEGKTVLFSKGADSRVGVLKEPIPSDSVAHINKFAKEGLRTLFVARKEISDEEYERWLPLWQKADHALVRKRMNKCMISPSNIERLVLGCIDADFCK